MLERKLRQVLLGSLTAGALVVGLGVSPAAAIPQVFQINTDAVPGTTNFNTVTATHFQGPTESLITQIGLTQEEVGWVRLNGMTFFSTPLSTGTTGLSVPPDETIFGAQIWGSYILFEASSALTSFAPNTQGPLTGFSIAWYLDPLTNTELDGASTGNNPGVVSGASDDDDLLVAVGTYVPGSGSAGFQGNGAPIFSAIANFILCNGTAGQGVQGGTLTAGTVNIDGIDHTCGTYNGTSFFVAPNPFYAFNFDAATASGEGDVIPLSATELQLTGVTASISFTGSIPEPGTLMLVGFGLLGLGWVTRRRSQT